MKNRGVPVVAIDEGQLLGHLVALVVAALLAGGLQLLGYRWRWWPLGPDYSGLLPRWSWSLSIAAAIGLGAAAAFVAGAGPRVLLAAAGALAGTIAAGVGGFEGEREDRLSPRGCRRRRARLRIGPLEAVRRLRSRRALEGAERVAYNPDAGEDELALAIGRDRRGYPCGLCRRQLGRCGLITGMTGAGKSWTAHVVAQGAVLGAGMGLIWCEAKGDRDTVRRLAALALRAQRPFWIFDLAGRGQSWDPLAIARGPTERRDLLFKALEHTFEGSPEYYATLFREHSLVVFRALEGAGIAPTIRAARRAWAPVALRDLQLRMGSHPDSDDVGAHLAALEGGRNQRREHVESVGGRLAELDDAAGHLLDPGEDEPAERIDIARVMASGGICLISLEAQTYPSVTRSVGQLLVADIAASCAPLIAAERSGACMVVLDEFGQYAGAAVQPLMALTARQAGVPVVLATQDIADMAAVDEHFRERASANFGWFAGQMTATPESADWLGRVSGQEEVVEATKKTVRWEGDLDHQSGEGTQAYGRQWRIHPEEFQSLRTGEAGLVTKGPHTANVISVYRPLSAEQLLAATGAPAEGSWSPQAVASRFAQLRRAAQAA